MSETVKSAPGNPTTKLETVEFCRFCLMCRHLCPVGHVTHRETLTPHGWGLLISSERKGLIEWNGESVDALYMCADCGLCQDHCVTDQPLPDAIAEARSRVVERGESPTRVTEVDRRLQNWANPYRESKPEPAGGAGETGIFVGDAALYRSPDALNAGLTLLKALDLEPVRIGAGRSNGHLASSLGLPETASRLARDLLEEIGGVGCRRLIVLCPGDHYAFKTLYRERLGLEWPEEVTVVELADLLAGAFEEGRLRLRRKDGPMPWAFLDAPHSQRAASSPDLRRRLLAAALGEENRVELFWRRERAHPDGSVGGLEWIRPELAARLSKARLEDARRAGARLVIVEDPASLAHLREQARSGLELSGLSETLIEHWDRE